LHRSLESIALLHRHLACEHFPRSLPRECANEHSQRFFAMIARRTPSYPALTPPIALLSRPDHNAWLSVLGASLDLKR
jgi:hypothetical protein